MNDLIHIVFSESSSKALQASFDLQPSMEGDILVIKEAFEFGPIVQISSPEGFATRKAWWMSVQNSDVDSVKMDLLDDKMSVHQLLKKLESDASLEVYIWLGQNVHDVCGYYWLIGQLMAFEGRIQILYLNNLPFINAEGGIFYPKYLFEIAPKEFTKAVKLARPVTISEFELDSDEWLHLCQENAEVRILEGGKKIVGKEYANFDQEILSLLGEKSMKLSRLYALFVAQYCNPEVESIVLWRIQTLIKEGRLLSSGTWTKNWKDLAVKDTKGEMFVEMEMPEE